MIVELAPVAALDDVAELKTLVKARGGESHEVTLDKTQLVVVTGCPDGDSTALAALPAVSRVVVTHAASQLADRAFRPAGTVVDVAGLRVGDGSFTLAAGPCAVETPEQLRQSADAVAAYASLLRGGAFKPRTSPYSFQGIGAAGLEMLAAQRRRTGLRVVTEVMEPAQVDLVGSYADMLQIGARNMQNFPLLRAVGQCGVPVLLKRGMSATLDEWLLAAEYLLSSGNSSVVLCERGIRTFETATRFTLDLTAVALAKRRTHLPVFVDPSHAAGIAELVPSLALAAAAVGADGALIDVHPDRRNALCDGTQALSPEQLTGLAQELDRQLRSAGRALSTVSAFASVAGR